MSGSMTMLFVAIGGAIGAVLRYLVALLVSFPFGTLAVNVIGCFLMGIAFVMIAERGFDRGVALVMTGALGGFTTFSAFSLDAWKLLEAERIQFAFGYVVGSLVLSLVGVAAGIAIARLMT